MVKGLELNDRYDSMRGWFAYELHKQMLNNPKIWLVTGDLGFGMFDKIKRDFPERFVNVGAAEQALMGVSIGLSYEGIIPITYSITPFLLYRPFETIRNYINRERVPIILVGGGRDKDYGHDGFSHWSEEDRKVMTLFPNIISAWPESKESIPDLFEMMLSNPVPYYLSLRR
jgi:transketolase